MKKGFTLIELLVVITIIGILSSIGLNTFTSTQKKSRDAKRKAHLKQLQDAFESYANDSTDNAYPESISNKIKSCGSAATPIACNWGSDSFVNLAHPTTIYILTLPEDPSLGQDYYYQRTATTKYILCTRLENTQDINGVKDPASGNPSFYAGPNCTGTANTCNYCVSSPNQALPDTI